MNILTPCLLPLGGRKTCDPDWFLWVNKNIKYNKNGLTKLTDNIKYKCPWFLDILLQHSALLNSEKQTLYISSILLYISIVAPTCICYLKFPKVCPKIKLSCNGVLKLWFPKFVTNKSKVLFWHKNKNLFEDKPHEYVRVTSSNPKSQNVFLTHWRCFETKPSYISRN